MIIIGVFAQFIYSQQISIDDSQPLNQLIESSLVQGCVQVSNIDSSVNGSINNLSSFGYFEKSNSNFPFENGIVLSSGDVNSAGNVFNDNPLNEGDNNWQTDVDLENALGISNTLNATSISFDFISASDVIQFNYILASEEYFANYPCNYSDGFAFLIKEAGTSNPYLNIAVIPGTSIPVNTNTIHDEIVGFCDPENEEYFEGYNIGDTNFNGRTTVMSASATITPNVQYKIKLIIADQTDRNFDSAVFIEGNSFTNTVSLGEDISTCDASTTLNANTNNPQASYVWYLNDAEIVGETTSTLFVDASGTYKVEITVPLNDTDCTFEDEIVITLNSIQTGPAVTDFELCDDSSNDGSEQFDLTTKNTEILAALPASAYTISYHGSFQNASDNTNAFSTVTNALNPQTIFVRAYDTNSGCIYVSTFNLVVNSFPTIIDPESVEICDNGNGSVFLTDYDNEITNNNSNLSVSYHYSQIDAEAGANAIASPYTPSNPNEQLFIRVINVNTGCVAYSSVMVEILESPDVNSTLQQINACEQDDDGFETFDLTSVLADVLQGLTNVTTSFHLSLEDAQNDVNPIVNPTTYENTTPDLQTVYIRVENNDNSCFEIVAIELHANILETGTNIRNFGACDTAPDDGAATFNLIDITTVIANGLPDIVITYYETEEDLNAASNPIDDTTPYIVNNNFQTLFLLIENSDCDNTTQIDLNVNASVTIQNLDPLTYCDTNDDTFTSIDLASFNSVLNEGVTNPIVEYYETETDAQLRENILPPFYNNTVNPTILYVRVIDASTGCYDIQPISIEVLPAPATISPSDFVICDDDQDGFSILDLTSKISEINSDSGVTFSFFPSETDADNETNEIANSTSYNAETSTVIAKVSFDSNGCYALVPIAIIVNTLPEFIPISNFQNCETDGNQVADFLLSDKDEEILNGQTGKEVLYFEDENDAINRVSILDKNTIYNNTSPIQTIYVRVENLTDTSCFGTSSFIMEVGSEPLFNAPLDVNVCDDISNDGIETFNLNDIRDEVVLNSPEALTVTFHLTQEDAENQANVLPDVFTNTINPQPLFVNVDNGTYCQGIATFELNIVQVPLVNSASALQVCDTNTDGFAAFDLTVAEFEVLTIRQDNVVITYYESEDDLIAQINPISSPTNYTNTSNPQTVYIEIENPDSNPACSVSVPIELIVNLPPDIANITVFNTCEDQSNSYDLNETLTSLIGTQANVIVSFHETLNEAQLNQSPLNTDYNYSTINDVVFVRAEFSDTNCFNISSFTIQVDPLPIANSIQNLEDCDDDFDSLLVFDLSQQTAIVLGSQNPNDFTVSYYETEAEAIANTNAISDLNYESENGQTFYIRVENNITNCFSTTSFSTIIYRKPFVEITDQVICLDNLPLTVTAETNEPTDSYLWSTGETSSVIEIDQIGSYSVAVTSVNNCVTTSNFNVIESEAAQIDFTVTPDFSDPHTITIETTGIGDYVFQLDDNEPQESNVFTNAPIGLHTVTVIDLNGCYPATKDIVIIDAPQFVTPNGDGFFDTWHITGVDQLPGTIVYVFDRYGKLLTTLSHTSLGWDGTYNGNPMPSNDYWFLAKVVKGTINFEVKGHFTLKR